MKNVIPYGRQSITEEDIKAVVDVLQSDFLTQGPQVELFEKQFSEFINCPYSVAVTNGTAALHLAALALGVKPGDKVLCTANSFVASANCVVYCGGDVEFVDIDPINFCIDIKLVEEKIKAKPAGYYKGIVAVDFAGYPVDFEKLRNLADQNKLWIIEDACHALGGEFKNSKGEMHKCGSGKYADISVFSFHPVKHIATGEGGMITTQSKVLYEKLLLLRSHGITKTPEKMSKFDGGWYYEMQTLGFNYRISDILCALGLSQLRRIKPNIQRRQEIAKKYSQELKDVVTVPQVETDNHHAYHLYVIQTTKRDELYKILKEKNIFTQVHYIPIYQQPYYVQRYGEIHQPIAEAYYKKALSLPMYHSLSDTDQNYVIDTIKGFFKSVCP